MKHLQFFVNDCIDMHNLIGDLKLKEKNVVYCNNFNFNTFYKTN